MKTNEKNYIDLKRFLSSNFLFTKMTVTGLISSPQTMVNTVFDNINRTTMRRYLFSVCLNQYLSVYFELL